MSLTFTDPRSNLTWKQDFFAASLVKPGDGLPPKIGEFQFIPLDAGLFGEHPLTRDHPGITVLHYAMVIPTKYYVTAGDGTRGVAFWLDNRKSELCASITSEMGRCNVAPLPWEGERAAAHPSWEWRMEEENGKQHLWTNARGHGFPGLDGRDSGYDWLDGSPISLATMYDRAHGQTAQTIFVPRFYEIGTAAQTLPADALMTTYSIMLYFPRPDAVQYARKLMQFPKLISPDDRPQAGVYRTSLDRGGADRSMAKSMSLEAMAFNMPEPTFEVTHGSAMKQHVLMPPMFPNFWQPDPSAVIVCWPIAPEQVGELSRPISTPGRKGFDWKNE